MRARAKKNKWYLDSGCFHHITGEKAMFFHISHENGNYVTFGDNTKGKIVGEGKVDKSLNPTIDDVLLISGLKHHLLSIGQFCDKNCRVVVGPTKCVVHNDHDVALFTGFRLNNVCIVDLFDSKAFNVKCLVVVNNDTWLWYKKLGHASMHMISKLSKHDLVKGSPKLKYEKDIVCKACVMRKHSKIFISFQKHHFYI